MADLSLKTSATDILSRDKWIFVAVIALTFLADLVLIQLPFSLTLVYSMIFTIVYLSVIILMNHYVRTRGLKTPEK